MKLYLGTWFGVPLYAHWSMIIYYVAILPTWAVFSAPFWYGVITLTSVFVAIALHEYGHTLAGKYLGFHVENVHLIAIGGIAGFAEMPEGDADEFWITLAGPVVNLGLFLLCNIGFAIAQINPYALLKGTENALTLAPWSPEFWAVFAVINLGIFIFNLIPTFPMDGGRIFRSILSYFVGVKKATDVAAAIGVAAGMAFITFGSINLNVLLVLIGGFLILVCHQEKKRIQEDSP